MKTLYDLLGALPHDDAEALRAAFRRAVKDTHPDIRPGDPDAALKFREIVRASEILGDAEQRAVYDELLGVARLEQDQASMRAIAAGVLRFAAGLIAFAGGSAVTLGGYLLFMQMSTSVAPANNGDAIAPSAAVQINAERVRSADAGPAPIPTDSEALCPQACRDGDLNAFAGIAREKPIERASRSRPAPARKPRFDQAVFAPPLPLPRRRTAAQDPSRQEGFALMKLR